MPDEIAVRRTSCRLKTQRMMRVVAILSLVAAISASSAIAQTDTQAASAGEAETFVQMMIRSSGWLGLLMLAMSFYLIALVVWMFLEYRQSKAIPEKLTADLAELTRLRRFSDIPARLSGEESFLGLVLASGFRKLPTGGLNGSLSAMAAANEAETMRMEHRTTYLATIGTLGPMIGLLGTVYGMILSFRVMATAGANPQASQLAEGISTALFATLEGIAISIPAIFFYAYFRNRISRLSVDVEMASTEIVEAVAVGLRPAHPILHPGTSITEGS